MIRQPKKIYLYGRLSQEDEKLGDSCSIVNQRNILTRYAEENGLVPYEFIYDDGFSGAGWDRPAITKLVEDVEAGLVSTVVVKDLSRFGRDYLHVGMLTEILFPKMDVRFIAIHDNVDSANGENDFAPIINVFNEIFVKSTSKKIRAVWQAKGKSGQRLAVIPPYGYRKSSSDPKQLVIDEESAAVVRRIFQMFTGGVGATEIAGRLMAEKLLNPSAYKYENGILQKPRPMKNPHLWSATTIYKILDAQEYLGHTVNFKTWTKSYKDNRCRWNPPDKQMVFEGTHPAIIDQTTWDTVRKMRQTKRRAPRYGKVGLFTGLAFCSSCGAKLYYLTREIRSKTATRYEGAYSCSEYRKNTAHGHPRLCTCHYISESLLTEIVTENTRRVFAFAANYEREFVRLYMENSETQQKRDIITKKRLLAQKRRRVDELDLLFERMYEDHVAGKLTDERFDKMSVRYEQEQKDIRAEVAAFETALAEQETRLDDVNRFLARVRKYTGLQELTPAIVNEVIDRIIVHDPEKARGKRVQQVDIIYNGIGAVDLTQLTPEQVAAM